MSKRLVMVVLVFGAMAVCAVALRAQEAPTAPVPGAPAPQQDKQPQSAIALPSLPSHSTVKVDLDASAAGPRQIEDTTEKAIVRDYSNAWSVMANALSANRADQLAAGFTGVAQDRLAARVTQQNKSGLHTKIIDHGHKLQAVFYSPEGSAMQLHDVADIEEQLLDGDKVISSRRAKVNYIALMTVGEERWKVRLLQETGPQ